MAHISRISKSRHLPLTLLGALILAGCHSTPPPSPYSRELPNQVLVHDVTFHSQALARDETYRIMARTPLNPGPIHVVYLLHGNGGSYRQWSESANLAPYAERNFVFIMPEGHDSYWVNSATEPQARYEDFLTHDLIADAERTLPAAHDRSIAGVSMGGFGALVLARRHPGLYIVAGALSPPVDVPHRRFSWRRFSQSLALRRIFGPAGSPQRTALDPFRLIETPTNPTPFLYLGEGHEPLAEPITRFDQALTRAHLPHQFVTQPGAHDWLQWNLHLPALFAAIESRSQSSPTTYGKP